MADISSRDNSKVKFVSRLALSASEREKSGLFVCEGRVMLNEALKSGAQPQEIFCLEDKTADIPDEISCPVYTVTEPVIKKLSSLDTPSGLVFTVKKPEARTISGRTIALERVSDPGNVGTVLRTADAFGFSCVALLNGCADPFSPKTVRASMGAVFRVNAVETDEKALLSAVRSSGKMLVAAVVDRKSETILKYNGKDCVFVIGNEASGLSQKMIDLCDAEVFIPISRAESLNAAVAASILMWESVR